MATTKPQQILRLTPASEITFNGPFDSVVTSFLELENPSDARVCFKVKTTAPRRYCVRPNSGIVAPGKRQRIAIMLQPVEKDSESERSKHKFMVQTTTIEAGYTNPEDVWKAATAENIMDSKLRCVFLMPTDTESKAPGNISSSSNTRATPDLLADATPITSKSGDAETNLTSLNTQQRQQNQQQSASTLSLKFNEQTRAGSMVKSGGGNDELNTSRAKDQPITSTPTRFSPPKNRRGVDDISIHKKASSSADKSIASSHNLTASFLQPMSDDHKVVLVSLIMLIVGVILGKYII